MEQIDLKKLETAIIYLDRIADGKSPVNNIPADDNDVLNNPNVIRCMHFVKEVLCEVKRNNGLIGKRAKKERKKPFPVELISEFTYTGDKTVSRIIGQLCQGIDMEQYKRLSASRVISWLKLNGYLLEMHSDEYNKKVTIPSESGKKLGITTEAKVASNGQRYLNVVYGKEAQEFIVKNIEKIINGELPDECL